MSLQPPDTRPSLPQLLYDIIARTKIDLTDVDLAPTLHHAQAETGSTCVILELLVDVTSPETMKRAAAHVRTIADRIEAAAAADKK